MLRDEIHNFLMLMLWLLRHSLRVRASNRFVFEKKMYTRKKNSKMSTGLTVRSVCTRETKYHANAR